MHHFRPFPDPTARQLKPPPPPCAARTWWGRSGARTRRGHLRRGAQLLFGKGTGGAEDGDGRGGVVLRELLARVAEMSAAVDELADRQTSGMETAPWWADGEYDSAEVER